MRVGAAGAAGAVIVTALAFASATPAFATAPAAPVLPLSVAVASTGDEGNVHPAQTEEWIDAQIAEATRLFTKHASIRFKKAESRTLAARHAHLETRADRDALAAFVKPGFLNVFVVDSLKDIDEADRMRMGVCWRVGGAQGVRFVVVSSIAKPSVLAHEIGHYHGLSHSKTLNNVMSYDRDGGPIFFDAIQSRTLRESAEAFVRDGVLVPALLSR